MDERSRGRVASKVFAVEPTDIVMVVLNQTKLRLGSIEIYRDLDLDVDRADSPPSDTLDSHNTTIPVSCRFCSSAVFLQMYDNRAESFFFKKNH